MNADFKMILGLSVIMILMTLAITWVSNTFALHGSLLIVFSISIGSFAHNLYEYCDSIVIKIGKNKC